MRTKLKPTAALGALLAAGLFAAPALAQTAATTEQAPAHTSQKDGVGTTFATSGADTSVNPTAAASAPVSGQPASFTSTTVSNGPVPDTPENRAKYGDPMSNAGKRTAPSGN